jgi:hypothetical protein
MCSSNASPLRFSLHGVRSPWRAEKAGQVQEHLHFQDSHEPRVRVGAAENSHISTVKFLNKRNYNSWVFPFQRHITVLHNQQMHFGVGRITDEPPL